MNKFPDSLQFLIGRQLCLKKAAAAYGCQYSTSYWPLTAPTSGSYGNCDFFSDMSIVTIIGFICHYSDKDRRYLSKTCQWHPIVLSELGMHILVAVAEDRLIDFLLKNEISLTYLDSGHWKLLS